MAHPIAATAPLKSCVHAIRASSSCTRRRTPAGSTKSKFTSQLSSASCSSRTTTPASRSWPGPFTPSADATPPLASRSPGVLLAKISNDACVSLCSSPKRRRLPQPPDNRARHFRNSALSLPSRRLLGGVPRACLRRQDGADQPEEGQEYPEDAENNMPFSKREHTDG